MDLEILKNYSLTILFLLCISRDVWLEIFARIATPFI